MIPDHFFFLLSIVKFDISVYRKQYRGKKDATFFYTKWEISSNRKVKFVLSSDDFIISKQITG